MNTDFSSHPEQLPFLHLANKKHPIHLGASITAILWQLTNQFLQHFPRCEWKITRCFFITRAHPPPWRLILLPLLSVPFSLHYIWWVCCFLRFFFYLKQMCSHLRDCELSCSFTLSIYLNYRQPMSCYGSYTKNPSDDEEDLLTAKTAWDVLKQDEKDESFWYAFTWLILAWNVLKPDVDVTSRWHRWRSNISLGKIIASKISKLIVHQ